MNRRQFLTAGSIGTGIGLTGCFANVDAGSSDKASSPDVEWETSEGHTEAHGGDNLAIFHHMGGDSIDTSESTIEPFHDDEGHNIERDISFMNHTTGNKYSEGDKLTVAIPESSPQIEFGERFGIKWTNSDITEHHTIGEHLWGQNYRDEVP